MANRESGAQSKNDKRTTTSLDDLPHEILVEFFLRLPVKFLIRSTSVNKNWYSLILNPNFISKQIHRSISCRDENAALIVPCSLKDEKYCSLVSVETGLVFDRYEIPFNTRTGILELVGSINGILCLTDRYMGIKYDGCQDFYLWNPSVRKFKRVASNFSKDLFDEWGRSFFAIGFGFHQPTNDYRVVRVVYGGDAKPDYLGKFPPRVEVFSLRMNNWREIQNPGVSRLNVYEIGVTVNNSVYWMDRGSTNTHSEKVWIVSFDFNNELFGQVQLPDDVRYCSGDIAFFELVKFDGSLSICVWTKSMNVGRHGLCCQPCFIWVMKSENGFISWTLRFKVTLTGQAWPLQITRSGSRLLVAPVEEFNSGILAYNLESNQDHQLGMPLAVTSCTVDASFSESLLLLEGGDEFKAAK